VAALVSDYRPKLRSQVRVDDGAIVDELLGRTIEVEGTAAEVARRLDGTRSWGAIRDALADQGHDPFDADRALRSFYLLHYVEGAGDPLRARLERVVDGSEEVPTSILDGARFACQGSGACCSGYSFGPLSDADVARLAEPDIARAFPQLGGHHVDTRADGGRYLPKQGDSCVFLGADRKCGIHTACGAEAKPHFCRLYPLDSFGTVEGLRIVDRGTCATFGVSARSGLPLYDDLARVHALLDAPVLHHPVAVVDGRGWDYGLYLRFTRWAIELIARNLRSAADTLGAIARCLDALAQGVALCPLEPGQPDQMVGNLLAMDGAVWYRPPRAEAALRGMRKLGELIGDLAATAAAALDASPATSSAPRLREFRLAADRIAAILAAADGSAPAPEHGRDVEQALRISLHQQLFGRHSLAGGHAGAGLVRMGILQLFALAGAREQAGARPLTAADLSRGHMIANRVFSTNLLEDLLSERDDEWRELVDGLWRAARAVDVPGA
jgi:Fe-S-cluster containining protein